MSKREKKKLKRIRKVFDIIEDISLLISFLGVLGLITVSGLLMGCCCSSCAEVEFYNPDKTYNYSNKVMFVESGIKLSDGTFYYIPLGYYNTEPPESDNDWYTVRIKAYDDIYKMTSKWTTSLTYPASIFSVLTETAEKYNLSLHWANNNYYPLTKPPTPSEFIEILYNYTQHRE